MGTSWSAHIVDAPRRLRRDINSVLARIVDEMSHWEPDSDIDRFNRSIVGRWQPLPPQFVQVLSAALDIAEASGGAFDPAIGLLADIWGFGPAGARQDVPGAYAIAEALAVSGRQHIEFDPSMRRARRLAAAQLDFSGIAKGFAVDAMAERLLGVGLTDFLVEIGGELRGEGIKPDGQPWWVDLEAIPGAGLAPIRVALHGLAVATSGDYRRAFTHQGKTFAHTLDPRTGRPLANGVASVTVLHAQAMYADAWATALTVLGSESMELAEREGLAAHMVVREGTHFTERLSSALQTMLA
ncbi:FAD:protein FMN transferase [Sphingomonas sp. JC676]|uniref:FAD:protein FMN transferase n=1 Tax=Sphingomonas sp. JC676 TaxID=2768065 RepID=UPI001657A10D|nr:FAD:protein FMN transferase [Sphingomonas sp. JC676]MBC9035031.1 FAD:protein FMN transferase [Sphingomonas sp. JC676]